MYARRTLKGDEFKKLDKAASEFVKKKATDKWADATIAFEDALKAALMKATGDDVKVAPNGILVDRDVKKGFIVRDRDGFRYKIDMQKDKALMLIKA